MSDSTSLFCAEVNEFQSRKARFRPWNNLFLVKISDEWHPTQKLLLNMKNSQISLCIISTTCKDEQHCDLTCFPFLVTYRGLKLQSISPDKRALKRERLINENNGFAESFWYYQVYLSNLSNNSMFIQGHNNIKRFFKYMLDLTKFAKLETCISK